MELRPIAEGDVEVLARFECGVESLDKWLARHALTAERNRTARTFLWEEDSEVAGYVSLAASTISQSDLPAPLQRGAMRNSPAVLIAKLAVRSSLQRGRRGEQLLVAALREILEATEKVGAAFVVVDAINAGAALFYERYGFQRLSGTTRLALRVSDIPA